MTPLAYQWCAVIVVGHTLYLVVTDFGGTRTTTAAAPMWPWIDLISHQVMDSIITHALFTAMLLQPTSLVPMPFSWPCVCFKRNQSI